MVHILQTNKRTGRTAGIAPTSVPSHSVLTDLAVGDDHPQYVRTDGTRAGWSVPAVFTSSVDGESRVYGNAVIRGASELHGCTFIGGNQVVEDEILHDEQRS